MLPCARLLLLLSFASASTAALLPSPRQPLLCTRRSFAGLLSSALLLPAATPALAADARPVAGDSADPARFLEQIRAPAAQETTSGKINGIPAEMLSGDDAEAIRRAAALMSEPSIPAGSDLDAMFSGDGAPRSVSSPLAHSN
eukprot:CAMPEP_0115877222 /NCGR_PEP_ID=MMETSP0287-20121206/26101_1 /TAXON_ID=412157 /ORGANISM="Chrysochromulina rotalis, Strain UIO044" /LENGTH=142 /DNA_ID=CAMNT_0003332709 /DNA_START=35 /DNA_END=463 /DNA_ORIENTATION=+